MSCHNRDNQVKRVTQLVNNEANETWLPHGIVFAITGVRDTDWGRAQVPSGARSLSSKEILMAGMQSPNRSASDVNVFLVPSVDFGIAGAGISPTVARQFGFVLPAPKPPAVQVVGSGLFLVSGSPPPVTGQTIAHEMGHYMGRGHSTGDLVGNQAIRDDVVSRRRLMYTVNILENSRFDWRNDTGYGKVNVPNLGIRGTNGAFITHRILPAAQDITFGESRRTRKYICGDTVANCPK
jgi:hypothetical protein